MTPANECARRISGSDAMAATWRALISAIDAIRSGSADAQTYQDFVDVHVEGMEGTGMHTWGMHSMAGMRARNFLAWHRWYLLRFEQRLQAEDPDVAIPYWDWIANPKIPVQINRQAQLALARGARVGSRPSPGAL